MSLAMHVADALGVKVVAVRRLHGGDLSEVVALHLDDGREVVAKGGPAPETETDMLRALKAAGAPTPEALAAGPWGLVMTCLPDDGSRPDDLGAVLRDLHKAVGTRYGWHGDYAFGPVGIENAWDMDWPHFWAERRLRPCVPYLPKSAARRLAKLCDRIASELPADPIPSLLHGDLWRGNLLTWRGRVSGLIDPACYYGHGEVDLAMLHLFGAPGADIDADYGPLAAGWPRRRAIYQLWPALVHVRLFGAGYLSLVDGLLNAAGG